MDQDKTTNQSSQVNNIFWVTKGCRLFFGGGGGGGGGGGKGYQLSNQNKIYNFLVLSKTYHFEDYLITGNEWSIMTTSAKLEYELTQFVGIYESKFFNWNA